MNNRFLSEKMLDIQREYLDLLQKMECTVESDDFMYLINEISLFWRSKQKFVDLYLQYAGEDKDAYLFCGATCLDFQANEHYPFLAAGNVHIIDDPLAKYADAIKKSMNTDFYQIMKKQIMLAFKDNLLILNNLLGEILILPITSITKFEEMIGDADPTEQLLLSLFQEPTDIKTLLSINDFNVLVSKFRQDVVDMIVFSEDDRPGDTMQDKLNKYLLSVGDPYGDISLAQKLLFVILGYFSQSMDILMTCAKYELIPYIRFNVTLRNLILIGYNFADSQEICFIIVGMIFANSLYHSLDSVSFDSVKLSYYVEKMHDISEERHWNISLIEKPYSKKFIYDLRNDVKRVADAVRREIQNCEE